MDWTSAQGTLARIPRRILAAVGGGIVILIMIFLLYPPLQTPSWPTLELPSITLDYHLPPYNASKVAILIENRSLPCLAPLMLHMIGVVPPEWRFRFMGSVESVAFLNSSKAIQHQVEIGKLDLTYIPKNMSTEGQEMISRFWTTLWLYETVLAPAEWLLVFQTDSILCANSDANLNDWLDYDWVGAPWNPSARYGGNGGLSLRRVSAITQILRNQRRIHHSEPEDIWLCERLGHRAGGKVANGTESLKFSGENVYTEKPMGYHTGWTGKALGGGIWGTPELRREVYEYCPEIKMTLEMDAAKFVEGDCNDRW